MRSITARILPLLMVCLALAACGPAVIHVPSSERPSAVPGAPKLLIRLDVANDDRGVGQHAADYLSDGAIIRWANNDAACVPSQLQCGSLETNTLTATGLATLRAFIDMGADLLADPITLRPRMPSGSRPQGGYQVYTIVQERPDGARYAINVPNSSWRSPNPLAPDQGKWAPDQAIERLNALAAVLVDPATLVGAGGLANAAWAPYHPVQMAFFVALGNVDPQFVSMGMAPDVAKTGWPFQDAPDALGEAFDGLAGFQRCAFLPTGDVLLALSRLPKSAGTSLAISRLAAGSTWHSGALLWTAKNPRTAIGLAVVALLPEDALASCADAIAY